jgi:protein phosphatase PTC7
MEQNITAVYSAQLPGEGKMNKNGEDAILITKCKKCFGVFDGVGEWIKFGVDSSAYSNKLSSSAKAIYEKEKIQDPNLLMHRAYIEAKDIVGTSTGCIIIIDGDKLFASNLGDSGFIIIRSLKVVLSSKSQQLGWNCPFQMGKDCTLNPKEHADNYTFDLKKGDIIVIATDGLWDNLSNGDVVTLLKTPGEKSADNIVKSAKAIMNSTTAQSPFAKEARKQKKQWSGGKPDDITVIVVII